MTEKTTDEPGTEEEVIPVGPDVESPEEEKDETTLETSAEGEGDDEGDEEEEDSRAGHAESEQEGRPRRLSHKERRARQRESKERDRAELRLLRSRNEELERRFSAMDTRLARSETVAIDQRLGQIKAQIKVADQVIAEAVEKGRGDDVVEAQNIKRELEGAASRLDQARRSVLRAAEERARAPAAQEGPTLTAAGRALGQRWAAAHEWYDPALGDEDSAIVGVIDTALSREGEFDPNSPQYWEELNRRVAARLPHRFGGKRKTNGHAAAEETEEERPRGGGPRFATGGRERPLRKNEVYISPERKAAMIEAGAWDDPILRQRYLKRYREWDREHGKMN